jgi:hypothetical protein
MTSPTESTSRVVVEDAPGLDLVARRRLLLSPVDAFFRLHPGDRSLVKEGEAVGRGQPVLEHFREPRTLVVPSTSGEGQQPVPGDRWIAPGGRGRDAHGAADGELLFRSGGRWRVAGGDRSEALESPVAGVVHEVRAGAGVTIRSIANGIIGRSALAGPSWGKLQVATGPDGELRAQHVDVGMAGSIIVAGARMDAEALTRARAVGIRGIVVAALGIKEQRDFLASERRGRAAVHGLPPFGILILDGASRRPIASPLMALFEAVEGGLVAIVGDPPVLVIDDPSVLLPSPAGDLVRVRSGPLAGAEGTWAGLAGPRRFPAGVTLEAAFVRFGGRPPVAIPLGDLERFA